LSPIRPREARAADGRSQSDWQAQGQAGSYGAAFPGDPGGQGYAPTGPGQPGAGYQGGGYSGGGYQGGGFGGPGQGGVGQSGAGQSGAGQSGQAPWQDQPWPGQQPAAQPVMQAAAPKTGAAKAGARHAAKGGQDTDAPDWAGPDVDAVEQFSERWERRGMDSRDDRRAGRVKHRRRLIAAAVAGALVVGGAAYYFIGKPGQHNNPGFGALVNSFLPGELQSVPDACTAVPVPMLNQYLPGNTPKNTKRAEPPLNAGASTQCTWTMDNAPTYRVLEVQMVAYSPSGLASGDGSATFAAEDAYSSALSGMQNPGPKSGQPQATITDLSGMPGGTDSSAFEATQVFNRSGSTTDIASVIVRYRNVIVTVVVNGLDHSNKGSYGPVSMSDLAAMARTVAHQVTTQVVG
jgi:hypothetical protein